MEGTFNGWISGKPLGTITPDDGSEDVLVHADISPHDLTEGSRLKFDVKNTPKGFVAINVELLSTTPVFAHDAEDDASRAMPSPDDHHDEGSLEMFEQPREEFTVTESLALGYESGASPFSIESSHSLDNEIESNTMNAEPWEERSAAQGEIYSRVPQAPQSEESIMVDSHPIIVPKWIAFAMPFILSISFKVHKRIAWTILVISIASFVVGITVLAGTYVGAALIIGGGILAVEACLLLKVIKVAQVSAQQ